MPARRSKRSSNKSGGLRICTPRSRSARDAITPTMRERRLVERFAIVLLLTDG
jgi:hypothetical protein